MREAWELIALDDDYKAAQAAWMTARARDRRRSGNSIVLVHTDFDEFFSYEKKLKELRNKQDVRSGRKLPGDDKLRRLSQHLAAQRKEERKEDENNA